MDIGGITSSYADYYTSLAGAAQNGKLSKTLEHTDSSLATDEELMDVCKQFESYLLEQVMDKMMDTAKVFSDEDEDKATSSLVDFFKDQTVQALCEESTERSSLGIAQMLYEQMKRNVGYTAEEVEALQQAKAQKAAEGQTSREAGHSAEISAGNES